MRIDGHIVALISIVGNALDLLGALYLAYDLLGGEHGPLRTLTRGVTYSVLFGTGYGLALGPVFGLASGLAHGITLAWEYSRASRQQPRAGLWFDSGMSAIRGLGFGLGAAYAFGATFGIWFGLLSTLGQTVAYRFGIRPDVNYQPGLRLRITRFMLLAALNRMIGYGVAGYVSSLMARHEHAVAVGLKAGLAIGAVTVVAGSCTPLVEWTADHLPAKRMGVFGVVLLLVGFALQSIQYWVALLS